MIIFVAEKLGSAGGSIDELIPQLNETKKNVINEVFTVGTDNNALKIQEIRKRIIRHHKDDLIKISEAKAKYPPYDPNLQYEEKIKNKIFKAENSLGNSLYIESDKDSKFYKPEWNYLEHIDNSPEFSEEEKEILIHCYEMGRVENRRVHGAGNIFEQMTKPTDLESSKEWINQMGTIFYVRVLDEIYPDTELNEAEANERGIYLVKRLIAFSRNQGVLNEALARRDKIKEDVKAEMDKILKENDFTQVDPDSAVFNLVGKVLNKKVANIFKGGEDAMLFDALKDNMGAEIAYHTHIYASYPDVRDALEVISGYSYDELGL